MSHDSMNTGQPWHVRRLLNWDQYDLLEEPSVRDSLRDVYALVGFIAIEFSRLDARLTDVLHLLIDPSERTLAATLTDGTPISRKLDLIKRVARVRGTDPTLKDLLEQVGQIKGYRNEFIHGEWMFEPRADGQVQADCLRHQLKYEEEGATRTWRFATTRRVTPEHLDHVAHQVVDARELAEAWIRDFDQQDGQ